MRKLKSSFASLMLLVFLVTHSSIAYATEEEVDADDDGEGDYVVLKQDEAAPFDGFLLHKNSMVKLITEKEHQIETLKISFETESKKISLILNNNLKKKHTLYSLYYVIPKNRN